MDRCALFVDAGYALADGAMAVHGTRRQASVSWDHAGLLKLLAGLARDRTGLPVLRCYWYETADGRTPEHDALAEMPGLKLRLVNGGTGQDKGIESQVRRDLMTLAKSGAISDAFIASANDHLAELVSEVQDLGLRVVVLHIDCASGWTIPQPLRQECDDIVEISAVHLRPFVDLVRRAEPSLPHELPGLSLSAITDSDQSSAVSPASGGPDRYERPAQPVPAMAASRPSPAGRESGGPSGSGGAPHHAAHAASVQPGNPYGPRPGERALDSAVPAGAAQARDSGQFPVLSSGPTGLDRVGSAVNGHAPNAPAQTANSHDRAANATAANVSMVSSAASGGPLNDAANGGSANESAAADKSPASGGVTGIYGAPGDIPRATSAPFATVPQQVVPASDGSTRSHPAPDGLRAPAVPASYQVPALPGNALAGAEQGRPQGGSGLNGGSGYPLDAPRNEAARNGTWPGARSPGGSASGAGSYQGSQSNGAAAESHSANGGLGMPRSGSGPVRSVTDDSVANGGNPTGGIASGAVPIGLSNGGRPNDGVPNGGVPNGGVPNGDVPNGGAVGGMSTGTANPAAGLQAPPVPAYQVPAPSPHAAPAPSLPAAPASSSPPAPAPNSRAVPSSHAAPAPSSPAVPARPTVRQPAVADHALSRQPSPSYPAGSSNSAGAAGPGYELGSPVLAARGAGPAHGLHPAQQYQRNPYQQQNHYHPQPPSAPPPVRPAQPAAVSLADAVKAAHNEGFSFGESVGREAPGLWLEAVLARKPRMPSDLEARLLQGSILPIDSLLHDEVRHSLRRGFWDALESARR